MHLDHPFQYQFLLTKKEIDIEINRKYNKIHTPGICGDGPRINNVILAAASASVFDIRFVKVAKKNVYNFFFYLNLCIILPSFDVIVVGTGISCVALIFVRPGRPSNAGSKTKEERER